MTNEEPLQVETNEVKTDTQNQTGCIGIVLSIGTYLSALICCVIFVVVLNKVNINASILLKAKYGLFFTGLFVSLFYFVSNILYSKNNHLCQNIFVLLTIFVRICYYTSVVD